MGGWVDELRTSLSGKAGIGTSSEEEGDDRGVVELTGEVERGAVFVWGGWVGG